MMGDPTSSVRPDDLSERAFRGSLAELGECAVPLPVISSSHPEGRARLLRLVVRVGWLGKFKHGDAEVVKLRQQLAAAAGIPQLEIVDPAVQGFAQRWAHSALSLPPSRLPMHR